MEKSSPLAQSRLPNLVRVNPILLEGEIDWLVCWVSMDPKTWSDSQVTLKSTRIEHNSTMLETLTESDFCQILPLWSMKTLTQTWNHLNLIRKSKANKVGALTRAKTTKMRQLSWAKKLLKRSATCNLWINRGISLIKHPLTAPYLCPITTKRKIPWRQRAKIIQCNRVTLILMTEKWLANNQVASHTHNYRYTTKAIY